MGGSSIESVLKALQRGEADTLIVLENDLYRRADCVTIDTLFGAAKRVIVLDHLVNPTTAKAELVLPAATFAEAEGTLVNNEGRAQRFYKVLMPRGEVMESWRWLRAVMVATGRAEAEKWEALDDVDAALAEAMPAFAPIREIAPPAGFRIAGQRIPRQPHRYSGRTAMNANVSVHEPKPPDDPDSPLSFSMEGYDGQPPSSLITRWWAPGWNSAQAVSKFQNEVAGPLKGGDPGKRLIEPKTGAMPAWSAGAPSAFVPRPGEWLAMPLHHILGTEELSILSVGVAELAPRPYLALNAEDAAALGAREGEELAVTVAGGLRRLPLRIVPSLPKGVAGLPVGLPGAPRAVRPEWITIGKVSVQ
jgi:NADH-quinone oxidoreductase subunit G